MKFKNISLLGFIAFVLCACDGKDEPDYAPADVPAENQRVFFASAEQTTLIDPDERSFDVYLYRPENKQAGELTVQLTVTDPSELFTFPQTVKFEPGENFTTITVGYDAASMEQNHPYTTYIAIDEANADMYGETTLKLIINYEVMTEWALFGAEEGTDKDGLGVWSLASIFSGYVFDGARVMERHIPSNPEVMEYELQLYDGDDMAEANPNDPYDSEIWFPVMKFSTTTGGDTITVPQQVFPLDPSVSLADANLLYPDDFEATSHWDELTGTFTLNIMYYDEEGAWSPGDETIVLNGYADTNDYTLTLTDMGQSVIEGKDYSLISFKYAPKSFIGILYTVVATEEDKPLTDEEISVIAESLMDPDQTTYPVEQVTSPGIVALTFPESGSYTLVAIGLNSMYEVKATGSLEFQFETAAPDDSIRSKFKSAKLPKRHQVLKNKN
ncbi:MAG: hypothetical protein NC301_04030 [Bacteroides sp.]|nr:hypothetical protein [Bacteroides sp.]MCM1379507.1 hypothetical protein [Bacteroides sp.]MCM1445890.1 hypothetical protein [Prevotella sp.]